MTRCHSHPSLLCRRLLTVMGICLVCQLGTGCSKLKELMGKKEEPVLSYEEEREVLGVKKEAKERFEAKLAEHPPFDRRGALKTILLDEYKYNLDEVFKQGYDPEDLKTKQEVQQIIKERAGDAANEKFSEKVYNDVQRMAEIEYPLIEVGDQLEVVTVRNQKYQGEVKKIDALVFQLGERELLIKDIKIPEPGCFHQETVDKLREHYMRKNYKIPKDDFFRDYAKQIYPQAMHEFGFIRDGETFRRIDEFIDMHIASRLDNMETTYRQNIEAQARQEVKNEMIEEGLLDINAPVPPQKLIDEATGAPPPPEPEE